MARNLVIVGVLYLTSFAAAGVVESRVEDNKGKEPEKKPNIVKDYICLRDGELCHPEFGKNRGLYVSCSNGVAWEQQCPRCSYHPLNCPTKSLWFDGEKCDWASPKLASKPCVDHVPTYEANTLSSGSSNNNNEKDEQEALLQSLSVPMPIQVPNGPPVDKPMNLQVPMYFKSPKYDGVSTPMQLQEVDLDEAIDEKESAQILSPSSEDDEPNKKLEGKSGKEANEPEFPAYLNADDSQVKIIKLSDPVYTLVNNPDGSGKQVLMRVSQPFVLEDTARSALPSINSLRSLRGKE